MEYESDPLLDNILEIENRSSLLAVNAKSNFQLDYSQFIELIRASYASSITMDKNFRNHISFGVFQYYCVLLLWLRLYFVLSERGQRIAELSELTNALNLTLPVPRDIKLYLQGVGDLKDISGHQYLLDVQGSLSNLTSYGAQGSYGKVTVSNLIIYETLPSLHIALLKIQADMLLDSNGTVDWNLQQYLKLGISSALTPNRNFLGWWPAEKLTSGQKSTLSQARITNFNFNVVNVSFLPINILLIKSVADQLLKSKGVAIAFMPLSRYGSIAQIAYTSRAMEYARMDKTRNIAGKVGRTNSCIQMPRSIAHASAIFRYRLKRYEKGLSDMVGYEFILNNISSEILANENRIFEFGDGIELWGRSDYRISEQSGRSLVQALSMKVRRK